MSKIVAIIPARYASTRFPGKPLALILGKPMFWHVARRAALCPQIDDVILAADDERILGAARELGIKAVATSPLHASGTDRVLEAARSLKLPQDSVVVNVQGDEPALNPEMLTELVQPFADSRVQVATLGRVVNAEEAKSPNLVKIVRAASGLALYFSRSPVPFGRDSEPTYIGHIGMYAFRLPVLERFSALGESPLEKLEKLEQLRLLEAGIPIHVAMTRHACHGVDRPEDLEIVAKMMEKDSLQA